jgi:hypothetical protein
MLLHKKQLGYVYRKTGTGELFCGKIGFLHSGKSPMAQRMWHQFMCKHKLVTLSLSLLFLDSTGFEGRAKS